MGFLNFFKSKPPKLGEHKLLFLCFFHYSEFIKSKKIDVSKVNLDELFEPNQNYSLYVNEDDFINLTKSFIDILNVLEKKYRLNSLEDHVKEIKSYTESKFNSNEIEIDFKGFEKYIDLEFLKISRDVYVSEVYQTLLFVHRLSSYYHEKIRFWNGGLFIFIFISSVGFLFFRNINSSPETYKDLKITEILDL